MKALVINKKVSFDELTHTYLYNDKKLLTGVTTLMTKMGLSPEYPQTPEIMAAAARGTATHSLFEAFDNGEDVDMNAEFMQSYASYQLPVIASEYLVSDNKHIATMIDKVISTADESMVILGDVKRTSQLHNDRLMWQLSLGAYLFELQNPELKVQSLVAIWAHDDAVTLHDITRIDDAIIEELIRCFVKGEEFDNPLAEVPEVVMNYMTAASNTIAQMVKQKAEADAWLEQFKSGMMQLMAEHGVKKVAFEGMSCTYVPATTASKFDSTRFKKEQPEMYAGYLKESAVKESIRLTIK